MRRDIPGEIPANEGDLRALSQLAWYGELRDRCRIYERMMPQVFGGGNRILNISGTGKLQVVARTTPDMRVVVKDGIALVADSVYLQAADWTSGTFVPPGTGKVRKDLVQISQYAQAITVKTGVETTGTPAAPTVDPDCFALAEIYLRGGMTSIKNADDGVNGYIIDVRSPITGPAQGGATKVRELLDVDDTDIADMRALVYQQAGDKFRFVEMPSGGGGGTPIENLGDIGDVDVADAEIGDVLTLLLVGSQRVWKAVASSGGGGGGGVPDPLERFDVHRAQYPSMNFATAQLRNNRPYLEFPSSGDRAAYFTGHMPAGYNPSASGLLIEVWYAPSAMEAACFRICAAIERVTTGGGGISLNADNFSNDVAIRTAQHSVHTDMLVETISMTKTQVNNLAGGEMFRLRIKREKSHLDDDATAVMQLYQVVVRPVA